MPGRIGGSSYRPTTTTSSGGNTYVGQTNGSDLAARIAAAKQAQQAQKTQATQTAAAAGVQLPSGMRTGDHAWFNYQASRTPTGASTPQSPSSPTPPGSGRSGYGSYGGGGGAAPLPDFGQFAAAFKKVLGQDIANPYAGMTDHYKGIKNPYAGREFALTKMIDPAVDADLAAARKAMNAVAGGVSMENPYLALMGQKAPSMDPGLAALAQSQGVGQDQAQLVQGLQHDGEQMAQNWSNLANVLGLNHVAGQQGVIDASKVQGQSIEADLRAQRLAMKALAAQAQQAMDDKALDWDGNMALTRAGAATSRDQAAAEFTAGQAGAKQQSMLDLLNILMQNGATSFEGVV